ncbi:hypothetical protein Tsubulata_016201 [Turnera subulata]|uniref:Pectinesterase inhibitor domain-containing protein n=1 Tax=Turnera subulata TaxID=218843 RepID=A0A9Q0G707_9ROSI|nr:hypothetical protein Tsubulata_016201 [Turnera subulata]
MLSFTSCHKYFCVFLLAIFITIIAVSGDQETQDRIDKICRQMEDYGFCNKVFNDNLRATSTDFVGLTAITLDQTIQNATSTHQFIVDLLPKTTDPALKNALIACENGYRVVQQAFQEAKGFFQHHDYDSVQKSETIAPRAQGSCDTTFITPPAPASPLVERNRQMRILIAMALFTAHQLSP